MRDAKTLCVRNYYISADFVTLQYVHAMHVICAIYLNATEVLGEDVPDDGWAASEKTRPVKNIQLGNPAGFPGKKRRKSGLCYKKYFF